MCRYTDLHDASLHVVIFDNSLADNEAVSTGKKRIPGTIRSDGT
jgi:hypothetical protein